MIGFLRGIVHRFGADYVLLDVNNIGYRINFFHPEKLIIDEEIIIYTYEVIREDEQSLYGFLSLEEYELFTRLISVKGIGPKIASGMLAKASAERIIEAIENEDYIFIKSIGAGEKNAKQMFLDLKGKLIITAKEEVKNPMLDDVVEALKQFGFKSNEIKPVIKELAGLDLSTDEYIKRALTMIKK